MTISGGFAAALRFFFFSKDDIPSWAGAHDLNMAGQFQGGLQLFLGLFSKDDIHSWTGAHDLKVSGQFQGGLQLFLGLSSKDDIHMWTGPMVWKWQVIFRGCAAALRFFFQAEDGIRDLVRSRGLGDVYKRQV